MNFSKITNPLTNQTFSIFSTIGKNLLKNYIRVYKNLNPAINISGGAKMEQAKTVGKKVEAARQAKYYDVAEEISPGYDENGFEYEMLINGKMVIFEDRITNHIKEKKYKTGDILYIGGDEDMDEKFVIVLLTHPNFSEHFQHTPLYESYYKGYKLPLKMTPSQRKKVKYNTIITQIKEHYSSKDTREMYLELFFGADVEEPDEEDLKKWEEDAIKKWKKEGVWA